MGTSNHTHRVLIVEDEPELRRNMVRALRKDPSLQVVDAGAVEAALLLVDERAPDLILSDLDLPGRSGVELIGELVKRGVAAPVVFISGHVASFRGEIPTGPGIDVLSKPVGLEELRNLVDERLRRPVARGPVGAGGAAPFGVADYLQLASLGAHSVVLRIRRDDHEIGHIAVRDGVVWSAADRAGTGREAFLRLVLSGGAVDCRTVDMLDEAAQIGQSVEALLLEAAVLDDEHAAQLDAEAADAVESVRAEVARVGDALDAVLGEVPLDDVELPEAPEVDLEQEFQEACDRGVDALLGRDFVAAREAFLAADRWKPGDRLVTANLARLAAMGIGGGSAPEGDREDG